ncbi:MAG: acyl-CoA dehydrogenase family protein [Kofleriaceae bacterium]
MIDATLDAGLSNVLQMLRAFGERHLRPAGMDAERTGEPLPVDHPLFSVFGRLGFRFGMMEGGGSKSADKGGPKVEKRGARMGILAAEELAYWDQGSCMSLPGPGLGGGPMALLATPEQKKKYLKEAFKDPDKPAWGAYALTEPAAGSDVARIRSTAKRDGDHWIINGEKMFITNGARAEWVVWFATIDPSKGRAGHRAFIIEKGTPGYRPTRIEKKMGLTSSETAGLVCEDVRVHNSQMLGGGDTKESEGGFKVAMATFDLTRPMVAGMAVGIGRCAWERARDLAKEAFGKKPRATKEIILLDRLAHARRKLDAARLMCWKAAYKIDVGEPNTIEASMAKIYAPRAAMEACSIAIDVMGLAGITTDALVEKCYRDVKIFDIFEGTGEVQRIVLARRMLDFPSI